MEKNKKEFINEVTKMREDLNLLINKKYDLIDNINEEIVLLKHNVQFIDDYISINSGFQTAEKILDTESYLNKFKNKEMKNIDFTKKIFSSDESNSLLFILKYNGNLVEIFFPNPDLTKLNQMSEDYLSLIIQPLLKLKSSEKEMEINTQPNNNEFIRKLTIKNIKNFESAEKIYDIFHRLIEKLE